MTHEGRDAVEAVWRIESARIVGTLARFTGDFTLAEVVELDRAVALCMAEGPAAALPVVDDLVAGGRLAGSHLLPSVRGEVLRRLGRHDAARQEIEHAVELCASETER